MQYENKYKIFLLLQFFSVKIAYGSIGRNVVYARGLGGCGGIGRHARFRFWSARVQVQVLSSALTLREGSFLVDTGIGPYFIWKIIQYFLYEDLGKKNEQKKCRFIEILKYPVFVLYPSFFDDARAHHLQGDISLWKKQFYVYGYVSPVCSLSHGALG